MALAHPRELQPQRVEGICYGEAMVQPRRWSDLPDAWRERFQRFRTPEGFAEAMAQGLLVGKVLPNPDKLPCNQRFRLFLTLAEYATCLRQ